MGEDDRTDWPIRGEHSGGIAVLPIALQVQVHHATDEVQSLLKSLKPDCLLNESRQAAFVRAKPAEERPSACPHSLLGFITRHTEIQPAVVIGLGRRRNIKIC